MAELNIVEKAIALEGVDLLSGLTPDQLARIASIASEVRVAPGKVVPDPAKPWTRCLWCWTAAYRWPRMARRFTWRGKMKSWALGPCSTTNRCP